MIHAYRTSPEFYHPHERLFRLFDREISEPQSQLKRKVIDCVLVILERQANDCHSKEAMLQVFHQQHSLKILRRLGKNSFSAESISEEEESDPISPILRKARRQRMITAAPEQLQISRDNLSEEKQRHISEEKPKKLQPLYSRDRKVRKSHIEITSKSKKDGEKSAEKNKHSDRQKPDKQSVEKMTLEKLPELRKVKALSLGQQEESPVKRAIMERNIVYTEKHLLQPIDSPKTELERILLEIK